MVKSREEIQEYYSLVKEYFDELIVGEEKAKHVIISALLCDKNSRILISGKPGTGKSTISDSLARNFESRKISITSTLLPEDILNTFLNCPDIELVQLEEINRTSPKVQGGLIEILGSNMITIDGKTTRFKDFFCIATQNDSEISGIFDTPQAIYDRFDVNVFFGDLTLEELEEILFDFHRKVEKAPFNLKEMLNNSSETIDKFAYNKLDPQVIMEAVKKIKETPYYGQDPFGSSNVRGYEYMIEIATLNALVKGRKYILPDDIADYISNIFLHRINQSVIRMNSPEAKKVMEEIEQKVLSIKRPGN